MADYGKAYAIWKGSVGATEPEYMEMTKLVGEAILRQIPKKPVFRIETTYFEEWEVLKPVNKEFCRCAKCEGILNHWYVPKPMFCEKCGQAIDWGGADD